MKILFCCRAINNMAGGVERQAIYIMNEMAKRGHEIHLVTWDKKGAKAFYDMHPSISWTVLDMQDSTVKAGMAVRLKRMLFIRKHIRSVMPDVMISFQQGAFMSPRISSLGFGIPMIASERMSLSRIKIKETALMRFIYFNTLRLAQRITVQFKSYIAGYPEYLQHKIKALPNIVFPAAGFASPDKQHEDGSYTLLSVGRLSYEKDFDVLINAFASVADEFPDWKLVIAGDGRESEKLHNLVRATGMENRILLPGKIKDIATVYLQSHVFCLPSRWEGFPNALSEALSHGLPCVGFSECTGVRDLIENGKNGLLADGVGNAASLTECLRKLMSDKELRVGLGKEGVKSVGQYSPEKVFDMWENLFSEFKAK